MMDCRSFAHSKWRMVGIWFVSIHLGGDQWSVDIVVGVVRSPFQLGFCVCGIKWSDAPLSYFGVLKIGGYVLIGVWKLCFFFSQISVKKHATTLKRFHLSQILIVEKWRNVSHKEK